MIATGVVLLGCFYSLAKGGKPFKNLGWASELINTPPGDTVPPIKERQENFIEGRSKKRNPFDLRDPKAISQEVEYTPNNERFLITEKIGETNYRSPSYMTFDEYLNTTSKQEQTSYFQELVRNTGKAVGEDPVKPYKESVKNSLVDRLFGGEGVDIRPQGNVNLTMGVNFQRLDNPTLPLFQRTQGGFDFDMGIQMNVVGTIGNRLKLSTNYNTQQTFDIDNQLKLQFLSDNVFTEDAIIKKIEAGNVSMPLKSSLIQGAQNLFGVKTELQFGRLRTTLLASQQQSRRQEITLQGGAQQTNFSLTADSYEENRHFFLSHYNRNSYEPSLSNLPTVNSLFRITKLEVWITNDRNVTDGGVRDVIALTDLGESDVNNLQNSNSVFVTPGNAKDLRGQHLPFNDANNLYQDVTSSPSARNLTTAVTALENQFALKQATDFFPIRMRKLNPSEYTYNSELGFVSLNLTPQTPHVVGVSFQYSYNGKTYQVGEFAQDLPTSKDTLNVLYVKMLKSVRPQLNTPLNLLMMRNVYSLNAYQVNADGFKLDVMYQEPGGGEKRFLPQGPNAGISLLTLMGLDKLNRMNDPQPDGQFDFIPGITVLPQNGKVIFPMLEPFGKQIRNLFVVNGVEDPLSQKYVYQPLYDSTLTAAREFSELNRYVIKGSYKSTSTTDISLGSFNIPKNSVKVRSGGKELKEGVEFTVDYNIGRIKIIDESLISSGQALTVSFEDNSQFNAVNRSMVGSRFDFYINDKFNLGATFMRLTERPFTPKVNIGEDAMANNIFGFDVQYSNEAPWLTKLVDKLPFYSTKAPSNINFIGEVAYLLPGHNAATAVGGDKGGNVYLDDFEGGTNRRSIGMTPSTWFLASTPPQFPSASVANDFNYGKRRAKISWFAVDQTLTFNAAAFGLDPKYNESAFSRIWQQQEIYPKRVVVPNTITNLRMFDLAYYPNDRGPYNYETSPLRISDQDKFKLPKDNWGGIMRSLETNDFEQANVEFLEFWVMSPFTDEGNGSNTTGGDFYLELGDVSEDILKDNLRFFENGLPTPTSNVKVDTTIWSGVPRAQTITTNFDNDNSSRGLQDVGYDGFNDDRERFKNATFLQELKAFLKPDAYTRREKDPASDNFVEYNNTDVSAYPFIDTDPLGAVVARYKHFNNPQGNSPVNVGSQANLGSNSLIPDTEDINRDNTLNQNEAFFQYKIPIRPDPRNITQIDSAAAKYIQNKIVVQNKVDGQTVNVTWHLFKIPLDQFTTKVGGIADFRSIRFMRLYLTNWEEPVHFRFADMSFLSNQWRKFRRPLADAGIKPGPGDDDPTTIFDVNAVSLEYNSLRTPVNYVIPAGVPREQLVSSVPGGLQDEASMSLTVCNLQDGDARGVFKNLNLDLRLYDSLKMYVHAEARPNALPQAKGSLTCFVRLGSDMEDNYYEYELPLTYTEANQNKASQVWPADNNLNISIKELVAFKNARPGALANTLQTKSVPGRPGHKIKILGNPDLGLAKTVLIGLRNPKDDGMPQCAEIWVNELRMTGINEQSALAGNARLDVQVADLANITTSASYKSIGWGSIDQRVNQRSRNALITYDVATTISLHKFFPKTWNLRLPLYFQHSNSISIPQYDPYQTDIELSDRLKVSDPRDRDSISNTAISENKITSFNFTNVRIERNAANKKIPLPWDIQNFSLTYSYSKNSAHTPLIERNDMTTNRGVLDYNYTIPTVSLKPFASLIKKGTWLQWIKEMNISPFPNSVSFRSDMLRRYGETIYRFSDTRVPWVEKQFFWDRTYSLGWELTKGLRIQFNALNKAVIDEPLGEYKVGHRDTILNNIRNLGRTRTYNHSLNLTYQIPFRLLPATDWITGNLQYQTTYNWAAASLKTDTLGNVIQNTQKRSANFDFNFVNLYNKINYLKKINSPIQPKQKGKKGKNAEPTKDTANAKDEKGKEKEKKPHEPSMAERILLRPIMMIRNVKLNYSEDFSTTLPGFMPAPKYLGQSNNTATLAPGLDFAFGMQPDKNWLDQAASKGWMTNNIYLNQQFTQTHSRTFDIKAQIEPFPDFRIDIDLNKTETNTTTEFFKIPTLGETQHQHLNQMQIGTFSMTYLPIATSFSAKDTTSVRRLFSDFESSRKVISERLGVGTHSTDNGYAYGYGRSQQDVVLSAFLATYAGKDPKTAYIGDIRNMFPLPNWRINFTGLTKLEPIKKIFQSVTLTHAYTSKLSVSAFQTDVDFRDNPTQLDIRTGSFYSKFEFPNIIVNENFSPLIGIDVRTNKNFTTRVEYKKGRILSMGLLDYQLTETQNQEFVVGLGYNLKNYNLLEKLGLSKKKKKSKKKSKNDTSTTPDPNKPKDKDDDEPVNFINVGLGNVRPIHDLNMRFDLAWKDDFTVNHIMDQNTSVGTRGQQTLRIAPNFDYIVNNRVTFKLFYEFNFTKPYVSSSFPIFTNRGGVTMTFSLSQ